MYAIIHFTDEERIDVVPAIWVKVMKNGSNCCFWPPAHLLKGQAFAKALGSCVAPDVSWDLHSAEILKLTDDYYIAYRWRDKAVACKSVRHMDLDTSDVNEGRKLQPPPVMNWPETDSVDSDDGRELRMKSETERRKSAPACPSTRATLTTEIYSVDSDSEEEPRVKRKKKEKQSSFLAAPSARMKQTSDIGSECSNKLLMERILGMVEQNRMLLQNIKRRLGGSELLSSDLTADFNLPMSSMQAFVEVQELLDDKCKYRTLVSHLATFGGGTPSKIIRMIMENLFTTELAKTFNWKGKGAKTGLAGSNIARAIFDAGKESGLTVAESTDIIQKWLKNANDREGGRLKRRLQKLEKMKDFIAEACEDNESDS